MAIARCAGALAAMSPTLVGDDSSLVMRRAVTVMDGSPRRVSWGRVDTPALTGTSLRSTEDDFAVWG